MTLETGILSVANKPIELSVIMLNVVAPNFLPGLPNTCENYSGAPY